MDGYLHIYQANTTHVKLFHTSMMCQRNSGAILHMANLDDGGYFNTTNVDRQCS